MVDYLTLCFHRERRLVELRGPRWRAGRGVWGRWAAEELWVPWSCGRNQQRLSTNQWFQLLLPPLRQVTHFSSFWSLRHLIFFLPHIPACSYSWKPHSLCISSHRFKGFLNRLNKCRHRTKWVIVSQPAGGVFRQWQQWQRMRRRWHEWLTHSYISGAERNMDSFVIHYKNVMCKPVCGRLSRISGCTKSSETRIILADLQKMDLLRV